MLALIVDDEKYIQLIVRKFLNHFSVDAKELSNGKDALALIESEEKFDLIFLDISLPDISGQTIAKKIRETLPSTKIILMSGYQEVDIDNLDNSTYDYYLFKPDIGTELERIVSEIVSAEK